MLLRSRRPERRRPCPPPASRPAGLRSAGDGGGRAASLAAPIRPAPETTRWPKDAELDAVPSGRELRRCPRTNGRRLETRYARGTRSALKYRRGAGEIIIVNHDGHGWWDVTGSAKGDVFNLVQHLDPSLNFGQVRQLLRGFVGIVPTCPEATREVAAECRQDAGAALGRARAADQGRSGWRYLTGPRACRPAC